MSLAYKEDNMDSPLLSFGTEVWRGGVNSWECDEMAHMNTRFYVGKCMEAVAVLFAMAGMPRVNASGSVRPDEMHIRFHREAKAATPLHITGGFSNIGESDAELVLLLHHSLSGLLAASYRLSVSHINPQGHPTTWPETFSTKAKKLMVETPKEAQPRSTGSAPLSTTQPDLSAHTRITLHELTVNDCDAAGVMLPQKFIAAASDGIRRVTAPVREFVVRHAEPSPQNFGGAVLEFRIVHFAWPRIGECIEIRSGLKGADSRVFRLDHWMIDPVTEAVLGYMEVVAIVFDLDQRKIVTITDAARAELKALEVA